MDSSPTMVNNHPAASPAPAALLPDFSSINDPKNFPSKFLWDDKVNAKRAEEECGDALVDLKGFLNGDEAVTQCLAEQLRAACITHGFFQVINHGVDMGKVNSFLEHMDAIFHLPKSTKMAVQRKPGEVIGYSGAHAERFSTNLPWKETFSFHYKHVGGEGHDVVDYIESALGKDFHEAGFAFQQYCDELKKLALVLLELLAISLGIDRMELRKFYEDGYTIVRGNYYPPCKESGLTLGTGPHTDPTSLTILYQDHVGGLEIFSGNKWLSVPPHRDAFVINLGDTFMALTNGIYKSSLHRAVVNQEIVRKSIAFFVNPRGDKTVCPPEGLLKDDEPRNYPDFIWSDFVDFTQLHYRVDGDTLQNFVDWVSSNKHHH